MGDARGGVGLVHELGQLRGAEELLDAGHDGTDVDQALRGDVVGVEGAHALADHALHAADADAELVLDELADGADAAVAEVVDVVGLVALGTVMELHDVLHGADDVVHGEGGLGGGQVEAQLLVDLVAADLGEVVALGVEEQALEQVAGGLDRGRLARAEALVQLDQGLLAVGGDVLGQGVLQHLGLTQELDDLLVGLGDAEGAQEQGRGLLALAVDAQGEHVALVGLELEPCAACGDDLGVVDHLVAGLVALGREVHAGGADQLGDDDALGAVDDEGAAAGHQGEVAHEDVGLLHLTGLGVDEADVNEEGGLVRDVALLALLDGVLGVAELVSAELHPQGMGVVLDRGHVLEGLRQALVHEALERVGLDGNQIGDVHDLGDLREAQAIAIDVGLCHLLSSFICEQIGSYECTLHQ